MLRDYEVVYIFSATFDEEAVNAKLESYATKLFGSNDGEVTAVDHWGTRQLAYPIKKQNQGYYVVTQFSADPVALPEYERILKLDEDLMRYLIVLSEGEPTSGKSIVVDRPVSEDRDEDDDDDGDRGRGRGREDDDGDDSGEDDEADDQNRTSPPEFSGGRARRRRIEGPRIELLNYKDVNTLSRFITEQGKLLPKRTSKVTAQFQRRLGTAVKRARFLSLLPYVRDHEA